MGDVAFKLNKHFLGPPFGFLDSIYGWVLLDIFGPINLPFWILGVAVFNVGPS